MAYYQSRLIIRKDKFIDKVSVCMFLLMILLLVNSNLYGQTTEVKLRTLIEKLPCNKQKIVYIRQMKSASDIENVVFSELEERRIINQIIGEVIAKLPKFSVKGVWLPLLDMLCRVETP
jgi:Tfp pilus assembly protein PilN